MINLYLLYLCVISGIFAICFMVVAYTYFTEVFGKVKLIAVLTTQNNEKEEGENGSCCVNSSDNVDDSICRQLKLILDNVKDQ